MKKLYLVLFLFLVCSLFADTFSVQGVLRDPLGKTVEDGYYTLNFKLYNDEMSGAAIWEETHESVLIGNGVYLVELGSVTSLDEVPFNENYWIGISVNGGTEMEPRIKMTKSPAAMSVFGVDNVFPSTGQVGVGTHEPQAYLHIVDSTSGMDKLRVEGEDGQNNLVVSSEGQVGVNVENPEADLHIKSTDVNSDKLLISNEDNSPVIVVKSDGKIGVNTATPMEALDITGNMKMRNGYIFFGDGTSMNSADFGGSASSVSNNDTVFISGDSDDDGNGGVEIRNSENTVIEVTADDDVVFEGNRLISFADKILIGHDVSYSGTPDIDIKGKFVSLRDGEQYSYNTGEWVYNEGGSLFVQHMIETDEIVINNFEDNYESMLIFSQAEMGWPFYMGTDEYSTKIVFGRGVHQNTYRLAEISYYGEFITVYSNRQNSEPYTGVLEKVMALNPVIYEEDNGRDQSRKKIGFSNEEVSRLLPELVYESSRENSIGINTSGYGIVAISAVQELNQKVENQEKRIEELEKTLAALLQEVKNLKN